MAQHCRSIFAREFINVAGRAASSTGEWLLSQCRPRRCGRLTVDDRPVTVTNRGGTLSRRGSVVNLLYLEMTSRVEHWSYHRRREGIRPRPPAVKTCVTTTIRHATCNYQACELPEIENHNSHICQITYNKSRNICTTLVDLISIMYSACSVYFMNLHLAANQRVQYNQWINEYS